MKRLYIILLALLAIISVAAPVYAGPFDAVKGWFSWTAVAFILSGILALGVVGKYTPWISRMLISLGTFATNLGLGLADGKVSADELRQWKTDFTALTATIKSGWKNGG